MKLRTWYCISNEKDLPEVEKISIRRPTTPNDPRHVGLVVFYGAGSKKFTTDAELYLTRADDVGLYNSLGALLGRLGPPPLEETKIEIV